jgi:hypothetical protein
MNKAKKPLFVAYGKRTDREMSKFLASIERDILNNWEDYDLYHLTEDSELDDDTSARCFEITVVAKEVPRPK